MKKLIVTVIVIIASLLMLASCVGENKNSNGVEDTKEITPEEQYNAVIESLLDAKLNAKEDKETENDDQKETDEIVETETPNIDVIVTYNYIKYEDVHTRKRDVFISDIYFKDLNSETQKMIRSKVLGLSDEVLYHDMCVTILSNGTAGFDFAIRPIMDYLNEELNLAIANDDADRIAEVVKLRKEFFANDSIANSQQKETETNFPYSTENHDKITPLD